MIDDHKAVYRERVESQKLSRLELQEQLDELRSSLTAGDLRKSSAPDSKPSRGLFLTSSARARRPRRRPSRRWSG